MEAKSRNWVRVTRWVARLWSVVPIAIALAEILFPHSEPGVRISWTDFLLLSLLFISVFSLALAWRWERFGGWASAITLGVLVVLFLITVERAFPTVLIFLVGIGVPAGLFLVSSYADRE